MSVCVCFVLIIRLHDLITHVPCVTFATIHVNILLLGFIYYLSLFATELVRMHTLYMYNDSVDANNVSITNTCIPLCMLCIVR